MDKNKCKHEQLREGRCLKCFQQVVPANDHNDHLDIALRALVEWQAEKAGLSVAAYLAARVVV